MKRVGLHACDYVLANPERQVQRRVSKWDVSWRFANVVHASTTRSPQAASARERVRSTHAVIAATASIASA